MTREQNVRSILESNFVGFKDEIIDVAVKNIMALSAEPCREADDYENEIADLHNRLDIAEYDKERYKEEITTLEAENKGEWISVSERLPEDRQSVLVWCPQYKNIYCAYLEKGQWWIFGAFIQIVPNEVVAWMPLPAPYKADMRGEI